MLDRIRVILFGCVTSLVLAVMGGNGWADSTPIGPGAVYAHRHGAEVPWAIHIVEADLAEEYLDVRALTGGAEQMARRQLSGIMQDAESRLVRPVAAVNADFFALANGNGIPLGVHVSDGEWFTFPDPARSAFYVLSDGTMHINRLRANVWLKGPEDLLFPVARLNRPPGYADAALFTPRYGESTWAEDDALQISLVGLTGIVRPNTTIGAKVASVDRGRSQRIPPEGAVVTARGVAAYALRNLGVGDEVTIWLGIKPEEGDIREAVSGGPRLMRDGVASVEHLRERFSEGFAARRHPRTGLGLRDSTLVFVVVDGRQPGYSEGMTLYEFAGVFADLGCTDAMNLDGGGSTTMVVRGEVVNSPSGGVQRAIVNGIGVFSAAPLGPPVQLALSPCEISALSGESVILRASGLDEYYNRVPVDAEDVEWESASMLGSVSPDGVFTAADVRVPTMGLVMARLGEIDSSVVVRVAPTPAHVVVTPAMTTLAPGATQSFSAQAYGRDNELISISQDRLRWRIEPTDMGAIDESGTLWAPNEPAKLSVMACVGEVCGTAEVSVGQELVVIEDFEGPAGQWQYQGRPTGTPGRVDVVEDESRKRNHCLELEYDLSLEEGTRTANALLNMPLGDTRAFAVLVRGDGQGAWLRARLRDGAGRSFSVDLASSVDWSGMWRRLTAGLPEEAEPPVVLESIYVAEFREYRKPFGAIHIDDIAASANGGTGADRGVTMQELPTYICEKTAEPITIDGHLSEGVWSRAKPLRGFVLADDSGEPQLPTEVKICWDERNLYLAFVAVDTDIWGTMRDRDDPIYDEEVVEAFLCSGDDVTQYFEFEFSPHNVVFDARIECPESGDRSRMKADLQWDCEGIESAVHVVGTLDERDDIDERWTVEVAIPFAQIGREERAPVEGERWCANFYRIDRAGEGEFSCWSPTLSDPPNFHVPGQFGRLQFSSESI